jgi:lipid-A-disaccharide synthase
MKGKNVGLVFDETYGLLSHAKAALVASGTASLETALFRVPQIVCYKTNWLTYIIAKTVIKIEHLSLVNILLGKEIIKELIQKKLKKENLCRELDNLFFEKERILAGYDKLSTLLNTKGKGASKNAARFILDSI